LPEARIGDRIGNTRCKRADLLDEEEKISASGKALKKTQRAVTNFAVENE
jgi:hypothetical protein